MSPTDAAPDAALESCPICHGRATRALYQRAQDPITGDVFQIAQCLECETAFTAPRPRSLDRYYPENYRGYGPLVRRLLIAFYGLRVGRWARLKPAGGSVLEIGCGHGAMLAAFKRRGWQVLGIERNPAIAERVARTEGIDVTSEPIEALGSERQFDLIIMFNVLEHIAEPVALLQQCARHLAPGGHLIANVPNLDSWQAHFGGPTWVHLDPPRHLVHFTPRTLAAALKRGGLDLVSTGWMSPEHDPYGWVESAINRVVRRPNIVTRFLMGIDGASIGAACGLAVGALLAIPASLLSVISWAAGRGALIEATATKAQLQQPIGDAGKSGRS